MIATAAGQAPPFCPNPSCPFHRSGGDCWRYRRHGFFPRQQSPHRVQRFQCGHCRRTFSTQTFLTTYWLKCPTLLPQIFHQLLACSGYRQIARQYRVSPTTILTHAARLGRHCLLFHEQLRPKGPFIESLVIDGFESFEFSQYHPTAFHVAVGSPSHFFHGFTDSELRRRGRMTERQKARRLWLESQFGRPHPRSIEHEVTALLGTLAPLPQRLTLYSDDHQAYPRALAQLPHLDVTHEITSSREPRTSSNPLFPVNLLDLLIRHSCANHKRETIAFSKRRQSAAERLWLLLVWRNYLKCFSEKKRDATPAMRLGVLERALSVADVLRRRIFPGRVPLPFRWRDYYRRGETTRRIPNGATHRLRYAF